MNLGLEDFLTFLLVIGWTVGKFYRLRTADRKRGQPAPSIPPVIAREVLSETEEDASKQEEPKDFGTSWEEREEASEDNEEEGLPFPQSIAREKVEPISSPKEVFPKTFPEPLPTVFANSSVEEEKQCISAQEFVQPAKIVFGKEEILSKNPQTSPSRLKTWMIGQVILGTPAFRRYR